MRKLYAFVLIFLCYVPDVLAIPPTTASHSLSFNSIDGGSLKLNWTRGNGARRIVVARQMQAVTATPIDGVDYHHDTNFGSGHELAPGEFVVYDGNSNSVDVKNLQPGTEYHFMIYEYNGTGAATEYLLDAPSASQITLSAPLTQPSAILVSQVSGNSMRLAWTAGSGSKRLVLARAGGPVNVNPSDLVNYSGNSNFGSGSELGSGNYVVHFSSSNAVTVNNLQPGTEYHFAIFESNGNTTPVFQTLSPLLVHQSTLDRPSLPATQMNFTSIDGSSVRVSWTSGNGSRRILVAREGEPVTALPADGMDYITGSATTASFATAPEISAGQKVVYDNTGTTMDVQGLQPNTIYHFSVFEYDVSSSSLVYLTSSFLSGSVSTAAPPTTQSSSIQFSNITGNAMKLTWTNGNGTRRIVLAKAGSSVDATPEDLLSYTGHSAFGNGSQIGSGNYVVYSGAGNTVSMSALSANQTYHFAIFEANGINKPVYNTLDPARGSQATTDRPTVAASSMIFSELEGDEMKITWQSGNGQKRIVVVRENEPVDAVPQDGMDYLATTSSSFADAPEMAPGQKVVYDNSGSSYKLDGLTTGVTYYYRVYEYSGSGSDITYLTAQYASGSQATLVAPTMPASSVSFSGITGNSMTISWVNGNGARRLVLVKEGAPVDAVPVNYTTYSTSGNFGGGSQLGSGNYVVVSGNSTSVTVNGLSLNTEYHVAVFECNGTDGPVYLTTNPARGSQTTALRPTMAASNLTFSQTDGNSFRLSFTLGNGQRRIIIAREGQPVDAVPADGIDYLSVNSTDFNSAPEIAPGQKVIYDNSGSSLVVSGIAPNTSYYFSVYEYSGSGSDIAYLTTNPATGSHATLSPPTLPASNLSFTSVTANSLVVSWTIGNGSSRMLIGRKGAPVNISPQDLTAYVGSANFGSGTHMGDGNYVMSKNNTTNFTVTGLEAGTTYHFAVYEYNGTSGMLFLQQAAVGNATTIGPPTQQAVNAFASHPGGNSLRINWSNGSGNRRLVLMKEHDPVDALPANNAAYFANSFFGSGTELGSGNYVVFAGIQESVTVTNLTPGTTYHFAIFEYNDFGSSSQFLLTSPATGSSGTLVLPVQFLSFQASPMQGRVKLTWSTAEERNSDHFMVERSSDGVTFRSIGRVNAAGNSTATMHYRFEDAAPATGDNYYRLRQADRDGQVTYSAIVKLRMTGSALIENLVNPVRTSLQMKLSLETGRSSTLQLTDVSGRRVMQAICNTSTIDLDLSSLKPGIYILTVMHGNQAESRQILKR